MPGLSPEESRRYVRHTMMPTFGEEAQLRLKNSSVLIVGVGGLGTPAATYLAAAGAGTVGLIDSDVVSESNLQRQVLFATKDIGEPKLDVVGRRLQELNPLIEIKQHSGRLTAENALELIRPYDLVIDGSDNFPTRFAVADACVLLGKPNVYGSIYQFEGQSTVFAPHLGGPCYRCMLPEPPPEGAAPT